MSPRMSNRIMFRPGLIIVMTLAVWGCVRERDARGASLACPVDGGMGGGTSDEKHALISALSFDSTGTLLRAAVVVSAPRAWRRRPAPDSQPSTWRVNGVPRLISGGTVGPLWIGHEQGAGTVWLDTIAVPLHTNNVLLLRVDADEVPRVVGRARVEPRLPLPAGVCGAPRTPEEGAALDRALWAAVRRDPSVGRFLDQ